MGASDFSSRSLSRRMVFPLIAFWVSVPAYLSFLFALLGKWVSRFHGHRASDEKLSSSAQKSITELYRAPKLPDPDIKPRAEESVFMSDDTGKPPVFMSDDTEKPIDDEKEESPFFLQFRFQTYDEFIERNRENNAEQNDLRSSHKWRGIDDDPELVHQVSGRSEEVGVHDQCDLFSLVSDDDPEEGLSYVNDDHLYDEAADLSAPITTEQDVNSTEISAPVTTEQDHHSADIRSPHTENDADSISVDEHEPRIPSINLLSEEGGNPNDSLVTEKYTPIHPAEESKEGNNLNGPVLLNPEDDFAVSSESDSEDSMLSGARSSNFSIRSSLIDSASDGFSPDIDISVQIDLSYMSNLDGTATKSKPGKKSHTSVANDDDLNFRNLSRGFETEQLNEEDEVILAELKRIEEETAAEEELMRSQNRKVNNHRKETSKKETTKDKDQDRSASVRSDYVEYEDEVEKDHPNEMEKEWEHQELIEQLKMEMKKVRATGLPTIFEESESLRISEDLKPWKIEDQEVKVVRVGGGTMDEIHKFYKGYRERMRKLDIFNYQKMYAIGFLRLKNPHQSLSNLDSFTPTTISLDCWPFQSSKPSDPKYPMLKLRRDLESDLETVYVGQLCLSWEFLHWQYEKALTLWDADPRSTKTYNEVAGDFQQFQVLLQRYLEDEPFQGPRVLSFVRNRCINRHILQVPLIREDSVKQRRAGSGKDTITSLMLVEMVEESIRVLWRFIRTDKDTKMKGLLGCRKTNVQLQNPEDAELLMEIEANLRKKYKKLRDVMRSECCILKKIQRHLGDELQLGVDEESCFFSQVDLKLVSRVLNMSRITTEQLGWCSGKLNTVKIVNNRIRIEPSFLLFPC